jgi:hypothetical protein
MKCAYCSKPDAVEHEDGVADGEGAACASCHSKYWHETPAGDATIRSMALELALYPCSRE